VAYSKGEIDYTNFSALEDEMMAIYQVAVRNACCVQAKSTQHDFLTESNNGQH
jgi:hypothetical protein